jgi:signal transduction histidine kinase
MNWNLFTISNLTLAISSLILTVLLFIFGKSKLHRVWGLYNFAVAIWGIGGFFAGATTSSELSLFWWKVAFVGVITIPIFLFHGTLLFCGINKHILLRFFYLLALLFLLLIPLNKYFKGINLIFSEFYYPIPGVAYCPFLFYWFTIVFISQVLLFQHYRESAGVKKMQIRYLFFGLLVGFSGGITNFLPSFSRNIYPFGNFGITLYGIIIAYAIFRFRLLAISVIITRATIFIAVYSLVLGIPFAIAFVAQERLINLFGVSWWMIPLVLSTFLATVGPFVYLYIDKKAEDRLLKEQKSYQNVLSGASSGMIRIKDLKRLLNLVVHVVTKAVRLKHASIYLLDRENNRFLLQAVRGKKDNSNADHFIDVGSPLVWSLSSKRESLVAEEAIMQFRGDVRNISLGKLVEQLVGLDAALVVPSFVENNLIGILILGEKISKKLYSQDDLNVFSVLANQAALAIENAQFYDEIKQTHEQLFQAEKLATIGTMADGLSHQINNRFHALSLISGDALDILKIFDMSSCTKETKQVLSDLKGALERIESNVLQGGEVVKGLLKYSRPGDSGFEKIDLRDVVSGAIDMVQYKIKLKDIALIQNIPADLPKIHGNLTQLQEAFFNLIDNAYDAIKERQSTLKEEGYRGRIEIAASGIDGYVEINISDNGVGVKDQDRKKLFTPFFTTKATSRKGTGLGLYVIDKIIKAHNGKIDVTSEHNVGTRFVMTLPLTKPS